MTPTLLTIPDLEAALAARIEIMDATPWVQSTTAPEVWAESDIPLTAMQDSTLQQHLAFSVSVESLPVLGEGDGGPRPAWVQVEAEVVLVYVYRLRTDDQLRDQRLAASAAPHLARRVLDPDPRWGVAVPLNLYQPRAQVGQWLPVAQTYRVAFHLSLSE